MVHSPNYERLKEFMSAAQVNGGLKAWETDHARTMQGFQDAIDRLAFYRANHGFTGAAADAMDSWVNRAIDRIQGYRDYYTQGYKTYESARDAMATALQEAQAVSPDLLDAKTAAMRDDWIVEIPKSSSVEGLNVPIINKKYTTGEAYVSAVEAQNNAQREASALRVLNEINVKTQGLGAKMAEIEIKSRPERYPPAPPPVPDKKPTPGGGGSGKGNGGGGGSGHSNGGGGSGHSNGGGGYSPENGFGREGGRNGEGYPDGFDKPWWSEADAAAARNRVIASGSVPTKELPYGELGSRTNPITDPQDLMDTDLLHTRVNGTTYRNGIAGGHTPAPAADSGHPLWRLNGGAAAADATTAGRLGGAGVLGAGALGMRGAARMGSGFGGASGSAGGMGAGGMGGLRGITGTTGSAGAMGASNLRVGTYSGSGFGSYTPPASVAGANGAAGAGTSGVTGTTGANGGGAAGAAGAAGRGGAGAGGGFMGGGGAGAGAGMGKDDKKGRKRKYVAFTVDEDEDDLPAGYVNPLSQTYGTDRTIAPVKREDDGWDLRQW